MVLSFFVDNYSIIGPVCSFIAVGFSWVTMLTENWLWYIPTCLFAGFALFLTGVTVFA